MSNDDWTTETTGDDTDWSAFDAPPITSVHTQPKPNPFLEAALYYARKGWRVIPLEPRSKLPHDNTHGCHSGTTDERQINLWWENWEDANVGIATGNGLLVLDVDIKEDKHGDESLAALQSEWGELPETYEVLTGSGGRQLYFAYPPSVKLGPTQDRLGRWLDTRADGGYVVAPPSSHPHTGQAYAWELSNHPEEGAIADAPQWLLDLLATTAEHRPRGDGLPLAEPIAARAAAEPSTALPTCRTALRSAAIRYLGNCDPAVQGEGGDKRTFNVAGQLAAFVCGHGSRLTAGDISDLLLTEYNGKCSPPWTAKEINSKVYSALRNGTPRKDKPVNCLKDTPATWDGGGIDLSGLSNFYEPAKMKNVKWLWRHRLPLGAATVISGGQGHGKSTMLYDIIARLSVGKQFPDGEIAPKCKTLILSAEDNPDDSAGPKLEAMGADHTMIKKWPVEFSMAQLPQLDQILAADPTIKLVMIEPLYEIISGDMNSDTKNVTQTIGKLQRMAQEREVTIIGVHHFGKGKADNANQKNIGSMGFTAKARACWGVVPSKSDPKVRIFAPGKTNVNLTDKALQFRIETATIAGPNDGDIETAKVVWLDEQLTTSLDDLLAEQVGTKKTTADVDAWLTDFLADGKQDASTIFKAAKDVGLTDNQIQDASKRCNVKKNKKSLGGGWEWAMPKRSNNSQREGEDWEKEAFTPS